MWFEENEIGYKGWITSKIKFAKPVCPLIVEFCYAVMTNS